MVESSDTFVAIAGDRSGRKNVVVYSSDPSYASTVVDEEPDDKTVTLYSLYYAESYETLISWYEAYHSDMTVKYVWGVDDENGISESDAISALNTQLLAGEGPDVIIMDGLNVGSYEDTGVLMELSKVYDDILQENPDCLENVLNAYRNSDGSIYAIPAMETFTAIIGPENEVKNVTDARSLAAYISSQDRPEYGNDLSFYYWECYFDTLYPVYASEIVDSDGNYDAEMLRKFLEDLKLLYDTEMERTTQDQIDEWTAEWGSYSDQVKRAINSEYMSPLFNRSWSGRKSAFVNMKTMGDMYPLYWTTSKEGIFMRYSYEFKLMCVELYHSGLYPDIPEDTNPDTLKRHIREWSGLVDLHGPEVLKHKVFNKVWTPEEKLELVLKVIAGIPKRKVATEAGISPGILYQWIYKYKSQGYNGLVGSKKGRSTKELKMKKSTNPLPLTESEREELMRLRSENEYIKAENEIIKKRIALRQEKWAAQLKAKKQQSSRTSEKKDTN